MDWTLAITRNREALQRLVVALFALAGLIEGRALNILPRRVHRAVLLILRPAESAVRRLIIIAAYGLILTPRTSRPFPGNIPAGSSQPSMPAFQLIDSLKRFSNCLTLVENSDHNDFWAEDEDAEEAEDWSEGGGQNTFPRISLPGHLDPVFASPVEPLDRAFINAAHLGRRLAALKRALENLPREAKRLARWQAKRRAALEQRKPMRLSAHRPGRPPGFRARHAHEVDGILKECHALMLDRLAEPDTS